MAKPSSCSTRTIVIDGANVVGARPDGWWRDRAGAAARLHAALSERFADNDEARIVLVLEGAARAGVPSGTSGPVSIVHAPGHGDDSLVDEVRAAQQGGAVVLLVTADRALRGRAGVPAVGPAWVWGDVERRRGRRDAPDDAPAATRASAPDGGPDMA